MLRLTAILLLSLLAACDAPQPVATVELQRPAIAEQPGAADRPSTGDYRCTVAEKASIESNHTEGSAPPVAVIEERMPTRFTIRIAAGPDNALQLTELPYDGADRDQREWHTPSSVIHGTYSWSGDSFRSDEDDEEAFFALRPTVHSNVDGNLSFYHSGFEWAGGEDTYLSIRWGRCRRL